MKKPTRTVLAQRSLIRPADLAAVRGGFFGAVREALGKQGTKHADEINSIEYVDDWSSSA